MSSPYLVIFLSICILPSSYPPPTPLQRYASVLSESFASSGSNYDYASNTFHINDEPTVEDALASSEMAVRNGCDSVIAIGGGSALDLGKAASALMKNSHRDIYDYLEVIGKGLPMENDPAPFIAVPTTSGTGSEVTKNAVLKSKKFGRKVSIRHEKMCVENIIKFIIFF